MYKKLYAITLLSLASLSVHSAEQLRKEIDERLAKATREQLLAGLNEKDERGNTPLHIAAFSPQERDANYPQFASLLTPENRIEKNYDSQQAHSAASLILAKADVSLNNTRGLTPLDIARENQERFPKIYEVLMAGQTTKTWNPPIAQPKNGSEYTLEEIMAVKDNIAAHQYLDTYVYAVKTLERYARSTQPTEQKN